MFGIDGISKKYQLEMNAQITPKHRVTPTEKYFVTLILPHTVNFRILPPVQIKGLNINVQLF